MHYILFQYHCLSQLPGQVGRWKVYLYNVENARFIGWGYNIVNPGMGLSFAGKNIGIIQLFDSSISDVHRTAQEEVDWNED